MRATAFRDGALAKRAGQFVWPSIDTEKETNLGFIERYPIESWPTLMVIDATMEKAVLRWPGSADVPRLLAIFDEGRRAVDGAGDATARGDRLVAEGKAKEAAGAYREALARAEAADRPHLVETMLNALATAHEDEACATAAVELAPCLARGPAFANAVAIGLSCAFSLHREAPRFSATKGIARGRGVRRRRRSGSRKG